MRRWFLLCVAVAMFVAMFLPFTALAMSAQTDMKNARYFDTADGKIRVYAYNAHGSAAMPDEAAQRVVDLFNAHQIRKSVLAAFDLKSIPQEEKGKTIVYFNSGQDCRGRTISNKDGTYHIEINQSAGQYVLTHEYVHVVQQNKYGLKYDLRYGWWMEGTADMLGKTLAGNDNYLSRLKLIQQAPWDAYDSGDLSKTGSRIYGTAALAMYLQSYDKDILAKSFERASRTNNMRDALNAALDKKFDSVFAEYAIRMYKPSRQMRDFVSYAVSWPNATCHVMNAVGDNSGVTFTRKQSLIGHLGVDYFQIQTVSSEQRTVNIRITRHSGVQYWLLKCGSDGTWTYEQMKSDNAVVEGMNTMITELVVAMVNTCGSSRSGMTVTAEVGTGNGSSSSAKAFMPY